jgi:hypothetical protein
VSSLIWIIEAILLGGLLIYRWTDLKILEPLWTRWLLISGAGAATGIGLTSCLFFICGPLLRIPIAARLLEIVALAWTGYEVFRMSRAAVKPAVTIRRSPALLALAAAVVLTVGIVTAAVAAVWESKPNGDWDAWAIWNLRARFLAEGDLANRAWSPILAAGSHAGYPLLVSAFIGRCWSFSHTFSSTAPMATSYVFFLSLVSLVASGVAVLRGPALAGLAALVLLASPSLVREVPAQYADIPLACYLAGAIVFALLDRPIVAGLFAGFASWTKDEGLLFLIVFLAAMAVFRKRAVLPAAAAAAPTVALLLFFKTVLTAFSAPQLSAGATGGAERVIDVTRYGTIAAAFGRELINMRAGWFHPVMPLVALAITLRFDSACRRNVAFCGAVAAALLAGVFGVYVLTTNDLSWMLETSLSRILMQVWPVVVLAAFLGLRKPEMERIQATVPPKTRRKAKR